MDDGNPAGRRHKVAAPWSTALRYCMDLQIYIASTHRQSNALTLDLSFFSTTMSHISDFWLNYRGRLQGRRNRGGGGGGNCPPPPPNSNTLKVLLRKRAFSSIFKSLNANFCPLRGTVIIEKAQGGKGAPFCLHGAFILSHNRSL